MIVGTKMRFWPLSGQSYLIVQLRYLHVGKSFMDQSIPECLLYLIFPVDDKELGYLFWVLAGEELAEVFVISMGAHAADAAYLGVDLMEDAEDMDFFGSGHQAAAQGTGFAIPYQQDRVAGVLDIIADMVFDATGIGHAAGGDDDAGFATIVQQFGLRHRLDVFQSLEGEGVFVRLENLLDRLIKEVWVFLDHLRGSYAKGAVYKIIQCRKAVIFFQAIESKEYLLCTAYAECGYDEFAFFLQAGVFDPFQQEVRGCVGRVVEAIAIGGFDEYIIGLGKLFGGFQDNVFVAAYVAAECEVYLSAVFLYSQAYGGAADDMPCIGITKFYSIFYFVPYIIINIYK